MLKKFKKNIFDVGAFNGIDGLGLAIKNPDSMVYAFEANPEMIKTIFLLKKRIEKRLGKKIKNYKYYNLAVSNEKKKSFFYIAKNRTVSSLNKFSKSIDVTWPGYKETHCHIVKKIKVKTITLKEFIKEEKIKYIDYIHVDTQGNDLKVLKGIGKKITNLRSGKIEAAVSSNKKLYENNHTLKDVKLFFKNKNFIIKKINYVDQNIKNEVDIYFEKKNFTKTNSIKTNYNKRYFRRILDEKTYFKDNLKDWFVRLFNQFN